MKTSDWCLEGDVWRCRWCGEYTKVGDKDTNHTEDCTHFWDDPPELPPEEAK